VNKDIGEDFEHISGVLNVFSQALYESAS